MFLDQAVLNVIPIHSVASAFPLQITLLPQDFS